ncbi:hypothetical protein BALH_1693 [Bacillus thuringiensis str. Al Hakam]|nr:hypothetical protein BALH_1693 [Bacillus thuringiensis str. Al Hakam]
MSEVAGFTVTCALTGNEKIPIAITVAIIVVPNFFIRFIFYLLLFIYNVSLSRKAKKLGGGGLIISGDTPLIRVSLYLPPTINL